MANTMLDFAIKITCTNSPFFTYLESVKTSVLKALFDYYVFTILYTIGNKDNF